MNSQAHEDPELSQEKKAKGAVDGSDEIDVHGDTDATDESLESISVPEAVEGMPWRVAESLLVLRRQINAAGPNRDKASDGTIGDDNHKKKGFANSDHNPHVLDGSMGVVTAMDVTHDAGDCDGNKLAAALHASRDPRIKYIIWNRRIANASPVGAAAAWAWRPYGGRNPHDHHVHLSVKADKSLYDSARPWKLTPG